jgi:hypothetical protein
MVPLLGHVPYVTHLHEVYEWQLGIFRALNWRTCASERRARAEHGTEECARLRACNP